ncbi:MAG: hypothetical protein ACOC4G_08770 [Bacillota bacterium]
MENSIGIIILLLLLTMVFIFLGTFIGLALDFIITVLVIGIPGIVFALVVLYIMAYVYPLLIYRRLKKEKYLAQILSIELKGNQLVKKIDNNLLKKKIKYASVFCLFVFLSIVLLYIYYYHLDYPYISTFFENSFIMSEIEGPDGGLEEVLFFYYSYLEDLTSSAIPAMMGYRSSPDFGLAAVASGTTAAGIFMFIRPDKLINNAVKKKVERLADNFEETNFPLINDIKDLEKRMRKVSDSWGCKIQYPYRNNIKKYIEKNKKKIIANPVYLQLKIEKEQKKAEDDLYSLLESYDSFQNTMNLAKSTSRVVNKTGSRSLIKEMDQIFLGLESPQLKKLISQRMWDDFADIIADIEENLRQLKRGAEQYLKSESRSRNRESAKRSSGQKQKSNSKSDKSKNKSDPKMSREEALSFLNLSKDSSKKEIKSRINKLLKAWHPDRYNHKERRISKEEWNERYIRLIEVNDYLKKNKF